MAAVTEEALRQALTERIGEERRQKLAQARVAVAGLGGLGSHVGVSLARMGIGCLHLVDFDRVELSNLNRQQYFLSDLGQYKTEALAALLRRINPWLRIVTSCVRITEENLGQLFADDAIICEALDNPAAKALLVNGILKTFKDKGVVAGSGMAGCGESGLIVTQKISGRFYLCGDGKSEAGFLTAPRVALCAAHQANLIVRLLWGME